MPAARLVILLFLLGTGLLIALQNGSPSLSLVFLGMETVALPLGTWIVIAIAAGALTVLWMGSLLHLVRLSTLGQRNSLQPPANSVSDYKVPDRKDSVGDSSLYDSHQTTSPPQPTSPTFERANTDDANATNYSSEAQEEATEEIEEEFDWEEPPPSQQAGNDEFDEANEFDWEEEQTNDRPVEDWRESYPVNGEETARRDRTFDDSTSDTDSSQSSDSVYSYGYREPRTSGVGRSEAVYDAEYRVIIPPYNSMDDGSQNDDLVEDDKDFLEDDTDRDWISEDDSDNSNR